MTFGNDLVQLCPECRYMFVSNTMASGNTFGGRFWSDGYTMAPMLPDTGFLMRCDYCGYLFLKEEGRKVGYTPLGTFMERPFMYSFFEDLPIIDYRRAVENKIWERAKGEERFQREWNLRLRFWQRINDSRRGSDREVENKWLKDFTENLKRIILLAERVDSLPYSLFAAESLRELGEFDKAKILLNTWEERVSSENEFTLLYNTVLRGTEEEKREVLPLEETRTVNRDDSPFHPLCEIPEDLL